MTGPTPHLTIAWRELRAARAIVLDPTCDDALAAGHLAAAWAALAAASDGPPVPGDSPASDPPRPVLGDSPASGPSQPVPGDSIGPRPEDRAALPPALAAAIDPVLPAILAERGRPALELRPWTVPHALLERHCDALAAILARRGAPPRPGRPWLARAGALAGLAALVVVALRPWQSEGAGPWVGNYYRRPDFSGPAVQRRDLDLRFDWKTEPPMDSIPADQYSVRWDTCLMVREAAKVPFQLVSDDGSRLFLDGELVLDNGGKHLAQARGGAIALTAGEHHLRVEYVEDRGDASVALLASFDGAAPAAIPRAMLRAPEGDGGAPCDQTAP